MIVSGQGDVLKGSAEWTRNGQVQKHEGGQITTAAAIGTVLKSFGSGQGTVKYSQLSAPFSPNGPSPKPPAIGKTAATKAAAAAADDDDDDGDDDGDDSDDDDGDDDDGDDDDRFYIALFSALKQARCAFVAYDSNEGLQSFIARF